MALKQCPECKQEISQSAKLCPHCGFKKPPAVSPVFAIFLILVGCLIAAAVIMGVVQTQQTNRAKAKLDESLRGADRMRQVYNLFRSPTPRPSAQLNRSTPDVTPADRETKPPNKAAAVTTPPPQFVTITQSVLVGSAAPRAGTRFEGLTARFFRGISASRAVLPAGTRLDFVSRVGSDVLIRYKGGEYIIPVSATDLK
jgi:Uncharacterised protein family UPF0547